MRVVALKREHAVDASWQRTKELFHQAIYLPADRRKAFLEEHCDGDAALHEQIVSLLTAHDNPPELLDDPSRLKLDGTAAAGQRIGRYTICRVIASGGMAVVYEAEQDSPKRVVALKVLRGGFVSRSAMSRLRHEAEILGRLRHPNIAHIHEAGTIGEGPNEQPYFAMEHIAGRGLLEYVRDRRLDTAGRLKLFIQICDAVQHAHSKGVIHRDLKPDNILVDEHDRPKILDFGVARVTDADIKAATVQTGIGQIIGTVPYMSPEQASGRTDDLDTRSDVYTLGVVLYELLSDKLPYEVSRKPIHEAVRVISEDEPTPLGTIDRVFRGDLATIAAKALEKDPERRYQSAAELAADIRHHLNHEPIVARPAGTAYQFSKFARRNKALVAGVATAFVVLLGGIVVTTWQWREARHQADQARTISRFLQGFLTGEELAGSERPVRYLDILNSAAETLDAAPLQEPLAEATLRHALGRAYSRLHQLERAETQLLAALGARRRILGPDDPLTLDTMEALGHVYIGFGGRHGKDLNARGILGEVVARRRRILGEDHPDTLESMYGLARAVGQLRLGKHDAAEIRYEHTLARCREALGDEHPTTLRTMGELAGLLLWRRRFGEADTLNQHVLDTRRSVDGPRHPATIDALFDRGFLHHKWGRLDEAERFMSEAVALADEVLPEDHWRRWDLHHEYGRLLTDLRRFADAESHALDALAALDAIEENPGSLRHDALAAVGEMYDAWGKPVEAERHYRRLLELEIKINFELPQWTKNNIARMLLAQGRVQEAQALFAEVLNCDPDLFTVHWWKGWFHVSYARCLLQLNRAEQAEAHLLWGWRRIHGGNGYENRRSAGATALQTLIDLYRARGETDLAAAYVELLEQWKTREDFGRYCLIEARNGCKEFRDGEAYLRPRCAEHLERFGELDPRTIDVLRTTAELYDAWSKPDRAEEYYRRVLVAQQRAGRDERFILHATNNIARMLLAQDRLEEAEELFAQIGEAGANALGGHWWGGWFQACRGRLLHAQGRFEQAEIYLLGGYEQVRTGGGAEIRDAELKETIEAFIALYDGWGKPDQAAEWRAELERPAAAPASEGAPAVP